MRTGFKIYYISATESADMRSTYRGFEKMGELEIFSFQLAQPIANDQHL